VLFASENRSNAHRENAYNRNSVNREKEVRSNLVWGEICCGDAVNMESNFETSQEVHKRGEIRM
jgi:hypothetical protein